jgi:DAK2 domain fusion protein YloV
MVPEMPPGLSSLDAAALIQVMRRFFGALEVHRDELNSLNVFPVPDGDTGTNLLLTQEAVVRALDALEPDPNLAAAGEAIARASLMGARGNSGVILSQVLRGLTQVLCAAANPDAGALARALGHAEQEAYQAVAEPKAGTILDVLKAAAEAGAAASPDGLAPAARAALHAGETALEATRDANPELRRAGVVDAGGKGLLLLLDALVAVIAGVDLSVAVGPFGPVGERGMELIPRSLEFELEVMYLLEAPDHAIPGLRAALGGIGDSVVVVGGDGAFSVHVHTNDEQGALAMGEAAGAVRDARVTSLAEQVAERCMAAQARATRFTEDQATVMVAVAEGAGFAELFRSLGAVVVPGGASANPSVEELLAAIQAAGARLVVLLPNHPNVVPAAERAAELAGSEVTVVPTRSMPEGISAATAFNPLLPASELEGAMRAARRECFAGALVPAARDAETDAGPASAGDWLAAEDGRIVAVGTEPAGVAVELVGRLAAAEHAELVSLYPGAEASPDHTSAIEAAIAGAFPRLELQVHPGGQPVYPYLISVE